MEEDNHAEGTPVTRVNELLKEFAAKNSYGFKPTFDDPFSSGYVGVGDMQHSFCCSDEGVHVGIKVVKYDDLCTLIPIIEEEIAKYIR